jgi:hypothetical protein
MESPDDKLEAYKGVAVIAVLLLLVVFAIPALIWFAFADAGTFWGVYSAWWAGVFLASAVFLVRYLVRDDGRKVGR